MLPPTVSVLWLTPKQCQLDGEQGRHRQSLLAKLSEQAERYDKAHWQCECTHLWHRPLEEGANEPWRCAAPSSWLGYRGSGPSALKSSIKDCKRTKRHSSDMEVPSGCIDPEPFEVTNLQRVMRKSHPECMDAWLKMTSTERLSARVLGWPRAGDSQHASNQSGALPGNHGRGLR